MNFRIKIISIFLITVSFFAYSQHELPEFPSCLDVNIPENSNIDDLIFNSKQNIDTDPLTSFCFLLQAQKKTRAKNEKVLIAHNADTISSQLYTVAKYKEAIYFQILAGDLWYELDSIKQYSKSLRKLGENFHRLGDIYNSLKYFNQANEINKKHSFQYEKYHTFIGLAWSYIQVGNFNEAEKNILLSKLMIDDKTIITNNYEYYYLYSWLTRSKARYTLVEQYDDSPLDTIDKRNSTHLLSLAMKYNDSSIIVAKKIGDIDLLAKAISNKANYLIYAKGSIDTIIEKITYALKINNQMNDKHQLSSNYGVLSKAYLYDKNYLKAIEAAKKGLEYAKETKNLYEITIKYGLLKQGHKEIGDYEKAFFYSEKYHNLYLETYGFRDFNNIFEIQKKSDERLNKNIITNLKITNKKNMQIYWLVSVISLLIFGGIISYYIILKNNQKRKSELLKEKLSYDLLQMEMNALRSRMNPHFIFNSLNSIKSFIVSNEVEKSVSYLSKFAKLLRYNLNNSSTDFVNLSDEITFLQDYVSLESLRLSNAIDFKIETPEGLDLDNMLIPPLIIQPFIENAIWHGLSLKKDIGLLKLMMLSTDKFLEIHIIDNGVGRETSAAVNKNKSHISKGISITEERLEIFSKIYGLKKPFKIVDLKEDDKAIGTEVIIKLPLLYNEDLIMNKRND